MHQAEKLDLIQNGSSTQVSFSPDDPADVSYLHHIAQAPSIAEILLPTYSADVRQQAIKTLVDLNSLIRSGAYPSISIQNEDSVSVNFPTQNDSGILATSRSKQHNIDESYFEPEALIPKCVSEIAVIPDETQFQQDPCQINQNIKSKQTRSKINKRENVNNREEIRSKTSHVSQVKEGKILFDELNNTTKEKLCSTRMDELRHKYACIVAYVFYGNVVQAALKWLQEPPKWNEDNPRKVTFVQPFNEKAIKINAEDRKILTKVLQTCAVLKSQKDVLQAILYQLREDFVSKKMKNFILNVTKNCENFIEIKKILCKTGNIKRGNKDEIIDALMHCITIKNRNNRAHVDGMINQSLLGSINHPGNESNVSVIFLVLAYFNCIFLITCFAMF